MLRKHWSDYPVVKAARARKSPLRRAVLRLTPLQMLPTEASYAPRPVIAVHLARTPTPSAVVRGGPPGCRAGLLPDQLLTRAPQLLTTPRSSLTARPDSLLPCVCGGAWRSLPSFCPLQIRWHPAALRSVRALFRLQPMPADVVHDRSIRQNSPAPAKGNGTGCCGGYGSAQRQKQALLQHPCARQKTIFRSLWSQLLKKLYSVPLSLTRLPLSSGSRTAR